MLLNRKTQVGKRDQERRRNTKQRKEYGRLSARTREDWQMLDKCSSFSVFVLIENVSCLSSGL